jgi:RHS repeat-associated protein
VHLTLYTDYKNGLKASFTGPDNIPIGYLYDSNNQLTGVQIPNVGMFSVNKYKWNRPAEETLPGGAKRLYQYDPLMRVQDIVSQDPGDNQQLNYGYTYDKVDNITAKQTEHGDYGYQYDSLYRLTDADNPAQPDEAFDYDRVGNRIGSADTTGPWTHNANNELEAYGTTTFQYDANGNMIGKNVGGTITRFFYNLEDRLERVEDSSGGVIATYYYDPFGRRLWKEVGASRTCFHYNDEGLIGEYAATGSEIKAYGWKPGSTWSTNPLFMKVGTEYYWYHNDHLGTPQVMTTNSGAVVWKAKYIAFGKATVDSASIVINPLRFAGQYEDVETGIHYNYHRYYDPKLGRYSSVDPVGMFPDGICSGTFNHFYLYVDGNPNINIDPEGFMKVHGNFCGPGHGDLKNSRPLSSSMDGGIDKCCYDHDKCYSDENVCSPYPLSIDKEICDYQMCNCLKQTKPPFKYWKVKYAIQKTFHCFDWQDARDPLIRIDF